MRRGHRGSGDSVDSSLAANPSGLDVQARGKDVNTFPIVGEICPLIAKS